MTAADNGAVIAAFVKEAAAAPQGSGAVAPFTAKAVSRDGSTAYATVTYKVEADDLTDADKAVPEKAVDEARDSGLTVEVGGTALAERSAAGGSYEVIGTQNLIARLLATPDTDGFLTLPDAVQALTDREREVVALDARDRAQTGRHRLPERPGQATPAQLTEASGAGTTRCRTGARVRRR